MIKAPTAAVGLVMVTAMCGLGSGAAVAESGGVAVSDEPTVVRLLGGGVMQVVTPDDGSHLTVASNLPSAFDVTDFFHPLEAVAPCQLNAAENAVLCPRDQVSSVLVLTGLGDDDVETRVRVPVVVSTGAGDDFATDIVSPEVHFVLGAGDDAVRPGTGANDVLGGPGEDTVSYRKADLLTDPIVVSLDDVTNDGADPGDDNIHSDVEDIFGGRGDDLYVGSGEANVIDGGQGDDLILGLGGDDTFATLFDNLDTGADAMFGGSGIDTVSYAHAVDAGVVVRLDDLAFDGQVGENDNVHSDVENIIGSEFPDVLTGSTASNDIHGLDGNDLIDGGLGADTLGAGPGVDTVTYFDRTTDLSVSLDDVANDGAAGELDNVAADFENITGGSGRDTLVGDAGSNVLAGESGGDVLSSLGGNDLIDGGFGADTMNGGSGTDTVTYAGRVSKVTVRLDLLANDGQQGELDLVRGLENVTGGGANDLLIGNDLRNVLRGSAGDDTLRGNGGNDLLVGDAGADIADGGAGTDTCQTETRIRCP